MSPCMRMYAVSMLIGCLAFSPAVAQVRFISEGDVQAVVITADDPAMVATYAAQELVDHIEKATGKRLQVVTEKNIPEGFASRIFVGMTEAARKQGIAAEQMKPDEFVLRTVGDDLYVLGMEDKARDVVLGEPSDTDWTHKILHDGIYGYNERGPSIVEPNGTLFGVYEILERYAGVRWLWPGELGTYVPRTDNLVIEEALDEYHTPKIPWRHFPWFHIRNATAEKYDPDTERMAFSPEGLRAFWKATGIYLGRHRMGFSSPPPTTKEEFAYKPWRRTTLSLEHPEFYAMGPDGRRWGQVSGYPPGHPDSKYRWADMCVSNPELHRFILEEVWGGGDTVRLGQVNTEEYCQCPECMAWDGPQPQPGTPRFKEGIRAISYRYARFWKTVYEMAAKRNPGVKATCLMYQQTKSAPLADIELNEHIYGEYCPPVWFPMPEARDAWSRQQWLGWSKTGMSMIWRPNHLHGSYTMPFLSTRQLGEFFKLAYKNGLAGYFFDSLRVDWATQGPMVYINMALGWDPELDIEELRQDFWSAFGPAARQIEQYFDYWEEYSLTADVPGGLYFPAAEISKYPPAVLAEQKPVLAEALKTAAADPLPEFAERVRFLQAGLEHARLSARFWSTLQRTSFSGAKVPADREGFLKAQQALKELVAFRRAKEHLFISDYIDAAAWRERGNVKGIDALFEE